MFLLFLLIFSLVGGAQNLTVSAPWLVVYDAEGRPRWEIRLEKLWRAKDGWEGEAVSVTIFSGGEPTIRVQATRIRAEALGRSWTLLGGLSGEGHGFSFSADEAAWNGQLILQGFRAQGKGLSLVAKEARWDLAGPLELFEAEVTGLSWTLRFPYGRHSEDMLLAQKAEAIGHGLVLHAEFLEFWVPEGRVKFRGVQVARRS